ncbi:transglutaminase domain-containing protein [Polaribacter vadi]|uniref:transglutaminase domain-containing protein n=1 Tax=Polaribacter vadi TaxID=1774273 RepID=UPI0030ED96CE|tara:strand:- start:22460 stop:23467 length:1008 start_codon:yes stop_codon:yes gene_type:complete
MQKALFVCIFFVNICFAQKADFNNINFSKADGIAKSYRSKNLLNLNEITFNITKDLETDVEKLRSIYVWICNNIANDFGLYTKNKRKRKRFQKDFIRLHEWNSEFKTLLFKRLLKRKKTICTGYAYLLKEMCTIVGIEAKIVNGFGRTSTVDFTTLTEANHSWNVVKINGKWYLCDPTWATGISFPEEGRFYFQFNEGYFLTAPQLFFKNHFPIEKEFSLLKDKTPTLQEFIEMPLLYGEAYNFLEAHLYPTKMHQEIKQNDVFTFEYQLKKEIKVDELKLVISSGSNERTVQPEINLQDKKLAITHQFKNRGFYDVHLYHQQKIIATYTFEISK